MEMTNTEMSYSIYVHVNQINGKMYIGITRQHPEDRWQNGTGYAYNTHFSRAISKYGWDNFDHVIFASGLTEAEACNMEKI
ncbi:MAG: GIY-YIG nuclease family protein [Clostridia bacterium]|nr:GIY-YIG nuclease family protein [Clostridia bacterium]